jgi:hypothetical protein
MFRANLSASPDQLTATGIGPISPAALAFYQQAIGIAASRGRPSFETACGFTIHAPVADVRVGNDLSINHWEEDGVTHVRVHNAWDRPGSSLLVQFQDGSGSVFAVKQEYIGNVQLEDGRVINVNYTPSASSHLFQKEYEPDHERIDQRRAFVATATRHGVFRIDESKAEEVAQYLRMMKSVDPTLGIYAAYAYQEAGKLRELRSVLMYMSRDPMPVPFDVVLLARPDSIPPFAPFCPMLTQGWALLELFPPISESIQDMRSMLKPGLWTTFTPEGVEVVRSRLEKGELK